MKKSTRICLKLVAAMSISIAGGIMYASKALHLTPVSLKNEQSSSLPAWALNTAMGGKHPSRYKESFHNFSGWICQSPAVNIAYLKIHKTGSSTVSKIFNLFGYLRNLSFLLPIDVRFGRGFIWEMKSPEEVRMSSLNHLVKAVVTSPPRFNLFTLHSTYNRQVLDKLMARDSKYVTSLRDPVGQFESAFTYYRFYLALPKEIRRDSSTHDKLREWLRKPQYYTDRFRRIMDDNRNLKPPDYRYRHLFCHNSQMRDLGFDMRYQADDSKVSAYISKLDREFDFVLIMEYFDESLVLMKKQFCWEMEDILYIPENQRPERMKSTSLPGNISDSIRRWNSADQQLYLHFNHTFWDRVKDYGPHFKSDLEAFRAQLKEVFDNCIGEQVDQEGFARVKYLQRKHAPEYCNLLAKSKNEMMEIIRERQQ